LSVKNKVLIIVAVIIIAGLTFVLVSSKKTSFPTTSPVPDTTAQKEFDQSVNDIPKIKPQKIESAKLPDHVISRFEKVVDGKLAFLGNDQTIYTIDMVSGQQSAFELPDSLLDEDATFATFNDSLSEAIVEYGSANKIVHIILANSESYIVDLDKPVGAIFADKTYIFSGSDTLKVSILENSKLSDYANLRINPVGVQATVFIKQVIIASSDGTYLLNSSQTKVSAGNNLILANNSKTLAVLNAKDIELLDGSLKKVRNLLISYNIKNIFVDSSDNVFLAASYSNEANDKLIKIDQDTSQSEIILPDQYPSFLQEFRIDRILAVTDSEIDYADQGNVFRIIL